MRLLVDAQLPRRPAKLMRAAGHDAIHTLDLPSGNRTSEIEIIAIAQRERRIVVTKDADFVISFTLSRQPEKLLLISTGNVTNTGLEALILPYLPAIVTALTTHDFVEVTRTALVMRS